MTAVALGIATVALLIASANLVMLVRDGREPTKLVAKLGVPRSHLAEASGTSRATFYRRRAPQGGAQ